MAASLTFLIAALARNCLATRFWPSQGLATLHTPSVHLQGRPLRTPVTLRSRAPRVGMQGPVDGEAQKRGAQDKRRERQTSPNSPHGRFGQVSPFDHFAELITSEEWQSNPFAEFATARNFAEFAPAQYYQLVDVGDTVADALANARTIPSRADTVADALAILRNDTFSTFVNADTAEGIPSYLKLFRNNLDKQHSSIWEAQNWVFKEWQEQRFAVFADEIDFHGKNVLDVGCGQGDFGKYLEERGIVPARLRGIDGMPEFVEAALQTAPPWAEYVLGDFVADPSVLGSEWDFIILSGSLTSFGPARQKQVLANCWRASRGGMAFNFITPTPGRKRKFGLRAPAADPFGEDCNHPGGMGRCLWQMRATTMMYWARELPGAKTAKLIEHYAERDDDATIIIRREDGAEDELPKSKNRTSYDLIWDKLTKTK